MTSDSLAQFSKDDLIALVLAQAEQIRAQAAQIVTQAAQIATLSARVAELPLALRALLADHTTKRFADRAAWTTHLDQIGIATRAVQHDPVRIATEGALWGAITAQGHLDGTVIPDQGPGPPMAPASSKPVPAQAGIGQHAQCWVHGQNA